MLKYYCCCTFLFLVLAVWVAPIGASVPASWTGYLVDQMCSEAHKSDKDPLSFVKHHPKDCALMDHCRAAGYAIYADGKWLKLDSQGSKLAEQAIRASKKPSGFYVTIDGDLTGDTIKTKSMQEATEDGK